MLFRTLTAAILLARLTFPETASVLPLQRALSLFNSGKYQECFDLVSGWVQQNPASATGHKLRGMSQYMLGRPKEALSEVQRATELAPNDADAFYYLGRLYFSADNSLAALAALQRAIQLDPSSSRNRNQLGQTLEALARDRHSE